MGSRAFCRKIRKFEQCFFIQSNDLLLLFIQSCWLTWLNECSVEWLTVTVVRIDSCYLYWYSNCFRVSLSIPCWFSANHCTFPGAETPFRATGNFIWRHEWRFLCCTTVSDLSLQSVPPCQDWPWIDRSARKLRTAMISFLKPRA